MSLILPEVTPERADLFKRLEGWVDTYFDYRVVEDNPDSVLDHIGKLHPMVMRELRRNGHEAVSPEYIMGLLVIRFNYVMRTRRRSSMREMMAVRDMILLGVSVQHRWPTVNAVDTKVMSAPLGAEPMTLAVPHSGIVEVNVYPPQEAFGVSNQFAASIPLEVGYSAAAQTLVLGADWSFMGPDLITYFRMGVFAREVFKGIEPGRLDIRRVSEGGAYPKSLQEFRLGGRAFKMSFDTGPQVLYIESVMIDTELERNRNDWKRPEEVQS